METLEGPPSHAQGFLSTLYVPVPVTPTVGMGGRKKKALEAQINLFMDRL